MTPWRDGGWEHFVGRMEGQVGGRLLFQMVVSGGLEWRGTGDGWVSQPSAERQIASQVPRERDLQEHETMTQEQSTGTRRVSGGDSDRE